MEMFIALASPSVSTVVRDAVPDHMRPEGKAKGHVKIGSVTLNTYNYEDDEKWHFRDSEREYLVVLRVYRMDGRTFYSQNNVWQHNMKGFARQVMDYLSSGTNVLISSDTQRRRGVKMWKTFLRTTNKHVYLYNKRTATEATEANLNFLIESAWQGNASNKLWVVAEKPVHVEELKWH